MNKPTKRMRANLGQLDKPVSVDSKSSNLIGRVEDLSLRETINKQTQLKILSYFIKQLNSPVKLSANKERILSCFRKELS